MSYKDELSRAMAWLGRQHNTVFLGQAVACRGTAMTGTLEGVPESKKVEMPVCEEMQMGMSIGMSLNGIVPVSIYPRWNFLVLAANQIVNHLDKVPAYSFYRPKVIVRVGVGSETPLYPGVQHVGDFTEAFRRMCPRIDVVKLVSEDQIFPAYQRAYEKDGSSIMVEISDRL